MKKYIRNINTIACKVRLVLIKSINKRLEVAKEEGQKIKKMVERQKTKAMTAKFQIARRRNSLSSKEKENYESDTRDKIDLNKASDNENSL